MSVASHSLLSEFQSLAESMLWTINAQRVMVAGTPDSDLGTPIDAYVVHGDANYYTVMMKLRQIRQRADNMGYTFPLVMCLNTLWPFARRDHYQAPESIPAQYCHSHTFSLGVRMGEPLADVGGFRTPRGAFAIREGGVRNGVLTAIEDFVHETPDLTFSTIPRHYGLSVITTRAMARKVWPCLAAEINDPTVIQAEAQRLRQLYQPRHGEVPTNVVLYSAYKTA